MYESEDQKSATKNIKTLFELWQSFKSLSFLNLHLCSFNGCFQWMFFNSVEEINRLLKERNSLLKETNSILSKGIWNIYINFTIEK